MQPFSRLSCLSLALALVLAPAAMGLTPASPASAHEAAQVIIDAVRAAEPEYASLHDLANFIAAHRTGLTPDQQAALARGGPVAPNHAILIDQIDAIRGDAALTPAQQGYQIARAATEAQARALGVTLPHVALAGHALPSDALVALAASVGRTLTAEENAQARSLDALPAPQAAALARVIDAYVAMNDAATLALHDAAPGARPDWSHTLRARLALLDAAEALRDALDAAEPTPPVKATSHDLYHIDFTLADNVHEHNYPLSIDVLGNDRYHNNAGGNWYGNCDMPTTASAFLDLSGDDVYAPPFDHNPGGPPNVYADECGKAGGANGGVGFLLDHGGNNAYGYGQDNGINGGANGPTSLGALISLAANDNNFQSRCTGTNGGATNQGVGLLVTTGTGRTILDGGCDGSNGGANEGGLGMLIDVSAFGSTYLAGSDGTNGGARNQGSIGFAFGSGTWIGGSRGVNGGATHGGQGTLITHGGGADAGQDGVNGGANGASPTGAPSTGALYGATGSVTATGGNGANGGGNNGAHGTLVATTCWCSAGSHGTNGGGHNLGTGFLYALDGSFSAGGNGVNGGANDLGIGYLLLAGLGGWSFDAPGGIGANGGGANSGIGTLIDAGINGAPHTTGSQGVNGGAYAAGHGLLIDAAGDDRYTAGNQGANGAAMASGAGLLLELAGNDAYDCSGPACNGQVVGIGGLALLLDVQGSDSYNGNTNWATQTVVPNGVGGARIDAS